MKVLITAGGTSESLDGVRTITNNSSGETGQLIAESLKAEGHEVKLLLSNNSKKSYLGDCVFFDSHEELDHLLDNLLTEWNPRWLIHSAAVSDFVVSKIVQNGAELSKGTKISSDSPISIEMLPSKKIINQIKSRFPNIKLFGFKFTNTTSREEQKQAVDKLLKNSKADYVLWNDANLKDETRHVFKIFDSTGENICKGGSKNEITTTIKNLLKEKK